MTLVTKFENRHSEKTTGSIMPHDKVTFAKIVNKFLHFMNHKDPISILARIQPFNMTVIVS